MSADDPFDLQRFLDPQAGAYDQAMAELTAGRKTSHWMWFVFPQVRGLGHSPTARRYAIGSPDEARAYLDHPILGPRLIAATVAATQAKAASLHDLFGSPDHLKFISSMTLFALSTPDPAPFQAALDRWNGGRLDRRTQELMRPGG
jgi:uncharacterized protein (DUF1810 family)